MAPVSGWLAGAASLLTIASAQKIIHDPSTACQKFGQTFKHENVTVNFAHHVPAGTNVTLPTAGDLASCDQASQVAPVDLCRLSMHVTTSNRSGITMEAWLPSNWTGRYMSTGNGGLNGCIKYVDVAYGTSFGFATVGANNGHNGTRGTSFQGNPDVVEDFAWRSLYTETIVGKAVTKAYYTNKINHAYYFGCSTGGRQGFKMVQDYPELFNGAVIGAPALAFNNLTSWSGHFLPITGTNTSDTWVSPAKWAIVHQDILKQCDGLDGAVDGILEDPSLCYYKPLTLQCPPNAKNTSVCLTSPQVLTVQNVLSDYHGKNGALIFPRAQPGSELASSYIEYNGEPFIYTVDWYRYAILNDPTWDPMTLDAETAAYAAAKDPSGIETWKGDLSAFRKKGGKILHYHGQMDSIITSANSPRYYDHVSNTMGLPPNEMDDFYRFFRIGGMDHCSGGLGAWSIGQTTVSGVDQVDQDAQYNIVRRMIDWVEKGDSYAPETVTGIKYVSDTPSAGVDYKRKHCRYPFRNQCKDGENYKDPESWECVI